MRCVSAWRFIKFVYCVLSKEPAVWSIAPTPQDASCLKTRGAANVLSAFMLTSVTEVGSPVFSYFYFNAFHHQFCQRETECTPELCWLCWLCLGLLNWRLNHNKYKNVYLSKISIKTLRLIPVLISLRILFQSLSLWKMSFRIMRLVCDSMHLAALTLFCKSSYTHFHVLFQHKYVVFCFFGGQPVTVQFHKDWGVWAHYPTAVYESLSTNKQSRGWSVSEERTT